MKFSPPIFHPNVFSNGGVCLSILNADWRAGISMKEMLIGIQELLDNPNANHVTDRPEISRLCKADKAEYRKKIKAQTLRFVAST